MAYGTTIFVRYKPDDAERRLPEQIASADSACPIPAVGEIIDCKNVGGSAVVQTTSYMVLSRYFEYWDNRYTVFFTVREARRDELARSVGGTMD